MLDSRDNNTTRPKGPSRRGKTRIQTYGKGEDDLKAKEDRAFSTRWIDTDVGQKQPEGDRQGNPNDLEDKSTICIIGSVFEQGYSTSYTYTKATEC